MLNLLIYFTISKYLPVTYMLCPLVPTSSLFSGRLLFALPPASQHTLGFLLFSQINFWRGSHAIPMQRGMVFTKIIIPYQKLGRIFAYLQWLSLLVCYDIAKQFCIIPT